MLIKQKYTKTMLEVKALHKLDTNKTKIFNERKI